MRVKGILQRVSDMTTYPRLIKCAVAAAALAAMPPASSAAAAEGATVAGVVLRVQDVRGDGGRAARLLLSTDEGICAVRVAGPADDWASYVDAEVEIAGELDGDEFVVDSPVDVQILKYPPTDPDVLVDVLPAGELVRRRLGRQREEAEARERRRRALVYIVVGVSALAAFAVLFYIIAAIRRKEHFFRNRLAKERRRTDRLHENIEQQLSGSRYLLETALTYSKGTPREVSETMSTVSEALSDINRKVHRKNTAMKSIEEARGAE